MEIQQHFRDHNKLGDFTALDGIITRDSYDAIIHFFFLFFLP